jgi:hypothetical protein
MERRSNKFKKAIHHLKSKQIDEKLELLNEIPTNNSAGIYVVEPEYQVQDPDVPGEVTREANFTQDALVNGRDTTGLFDVDGTTILTIEPPDALGDKSFILGPMASMWYAWGNFSTIGYIRQSDRRMVDLGRITGQLGSWNGTSGFTSYGQLLLNQAVWFRDTPKLNGADNNTPNYRSFYPGPPSNSPDQYGRYLCVITGTPKPTTTTPPPRRVPPVLGPFDPNLPPGSANPNKDKDKSEEDIRKELEMLAAALQRAYDSQYAAATQQAAVFAIPIGIGAWNASQVLAALIAAYGLSEAVKMIITGRLEDSFSGAIEALKSSELSDAEWEKNAERGRQRDATDAKEASERQRKADEELKKAKESGNKERIKRSEEEQRNADKNMERVQKKITVNRRQRSNARRERGLQGQGGMRGDRGWGDSYKLQGQVISEDRKRILKEIKKPYVLPEQPKVKYKVKPKANRTINPDLMKKAEVPTSFKPAEEKLWGKYEKEQNARFSQERKNEVLDHLGGSDHAWEYVTETSRKKNNDIMYGNFGDSKKKIVRKEELKGDTLLFIADENGKKESILQSELSIKIANEMNKELFSNYFQEQETLQADKDPLFKRVANKIKPVIDYPDKPSSEGYPNTPPPEMVNGWHPEYGQRDSMYNKMDPQSAEVMQRVKKLDKVRKVVKKNPEGD